MCRRESTPYPETAPRQVVARWLFAAHLFERWSLREASLRLDSSTCNPIRHTSQDDVRKNRKNDGRDHRLKGVDPAQDNELVHAVQKDRHAEHFEYRAPRFLDAPLARF